MRVINPTAACYPSTGLGCLKDKTFKGWRIGSAAKALIALTEDLCLVPNLKWQLTTVSNSSCTGSSGLPQNGMHVICKRTCRHANILAHKTEINKQEKGREEERREVLWSCGLWTEVQALWKSMSILKNWKTPFLDWDIWNTFLKDEKKNPKVSVAICDNMSGLR